MEFKIGSTYHGFLLESDRMVSELQSSAKIFVHEKTGARLFILHNDDDNKVFSISFRTPPNDSTGVAHIIEHAVLCGSRKFPVKEPFIELVKGSLNTFLNAMTFSDKTMYPIASRNAKDFHNLMDVYLDAVFYPNIYTQPETFMQEGWHYELDEPTADITYKGVVYNEMKGAFSSPFEVIQRKISEVLFPDTAYGVESGGDPDFIPQLSYQDFLDFHRKYYHPSNSYIYLYGDIDIMERLEFLDSEYLSHFEKQTIHSQIALQQPFTRTKDVAFHYPVSPSDSLDNKTYLTLNVAVESSRNPELVLALQILEYLLLETPAAPLKKALIDAEIGKDVFGSFYSSILQPILTIGVSGSEPEKKDLFLRTVYRTLQQLVVNGIDKKLIEASVNYFEFQLREANFGNYPKGLIYGIRCMASWLYDSDPLIHLTYEAVLNKIKTAFSTRYFENLIEQVLMDNTHRALVSLEPQAGLAEAKAKAVKQELAEYKANLSEEQLKELVEQTIQLKKYQAIPDAPENLEKIPLLEIADITSKPEYLPLEVRKEQNIKVLYHPIATNKIVYTNLYFDTAGVPLSQVPYVFLLSEILGKIGTEKYSFADLSNEININTGGITFSALAYSDKDNDRMFYPKFKVRAKVLEEKVDHLFSLITEILCFSQFDDVKRLKEIIAAVKYDWSMNMLQYAQEIVTTRALSYISPVANYNERGVMSFYHFISDLEKDFTNQADNIITNLRQVSRLIFNKNNLTMSVTCDTFPELVNFSQLLNSLSNDSALMEKYNLLLEQRNEGLMTAAKVQFVAQSANFKRSGFEYTGVMKVLETILRYDYLWNRVRVQGGAYGASIRFSSNGNMVFSSYRDPNLAETLQIYNTVPLYIRDLTLTKRELTKYIIGTISQLDMPLSSQMKGERADQQYFKHITAEDIYQERQEILQATEKSISALAELVRIAVQENIICVFGSEDKIKQEKTLFKNLVHVF